MVVEICIIYYIKINYMFRPFSLAIFGLIIEKFSKQLFNYQPEDGQRKGPKHVVDLYVINYTYLYHHIVVLDRYTHPNLVYYKHSGDDEPYEGFARFA